MTDVAAIYQIQAETGVDFLQAASIYFNRPENVRAEARTKVLYGLKVHGYYCDERFREEYEAAKELAAADPALELDVTPRRGWELRKR